MKTLTYQVIASENSPGPAHVMMHNWFYASSGSAASVYSMSVIGYCH